MAEKKKKKSATAIMPETAGIWAGRDYRAEDDHRTVTRAGEIMRDRDRMKAVKEHHKKLQKDMDKACK